MLNTNQMSVPKISGTMLLLGLITYIAFLGLLVYIITFFIGDKAKTNYWMILGVMLVIIISISIIDYYTIVNNCPVLIQNY